MQHLSCHAERNQLGDGQSEATAEGETEVDTYYGAIRLVDEKVPQVSVSNAEYVRSSAEGRKTARELRSDAEEGLRPRRHVEQTPTTQTMHPHEGVTTTTRSQAPNTE